MILPMNGYIVHRKKLFNHLVLQKENIKSVGTFLFDSTLKFEGAGRNCLLYKNFF